MSILKPTPENIQFAADALSRGELVGMPTETVYGLAADAQNAEAIRKVYQAKGRPSDNPLIVHVANFAQLTEIVEEVTPVAQMLIGSFWPGPITLVLPKKSHIPDSVTAGLDTVAVRMPAHPVALRLISLLDRPLAAPSANMFMALSPTHAEHIAPELAGRLACILDGGPCLVGLESTVVDCTSNTPIVLRPGVISQADIEDLLGRSIEIRTASDTKKSSPGMYARHYAPKTMLRLVEKLGPADAGLTLESPLNPQQIQLPRDPQQYAVGMYAALHTLDALGVPQLLVQEPPKGSAWDAVWDRLGKASTPL